VRGCVREIGGRRREGLCEGGWAEKKVRWREGGCWTEKKMRSKMKVG
jgi:hypothetical protein